ncbi:MAG: hypothetical protein HBSAPP04_22910 [Ignavibacteriaceae bacterium]|nr:MAG: hypothetical protein HBSAPP04_22910 [Ignavibacteriaceae bacterium]
MKVKQRKNETKIVIVEDDHHYRENLATTINRHPGYTCSSFYNADGFIEFLKNGGEVDILLLDIRLTGMSGLEAIAPILDLREELKILILTIYDDNPSIAWAMRAGVRGYLLKSSTEEEIIEHIERVKLGHIIYSVDVSRSEEHTSELQSPYVISYAVFCLKKKTQVILPSHHSKDAALTWQAV